MVWCMHLSIDLVFWGYKSCVRCFLLSPHSVAYVRCIVDTHFINVSMHSVSGYQNALG